MLGAVALGQLLSFLIALTGLFSSLLVRQGVSLPASQSLLNYASLALVYGGTLLYNKVRPTGPFYKYAILAVIDVLANFCLVLAYKYTSLTSVTLLDCFTVPCALLLSWVWLEAKYRVGHWAGSFICFAGLALLILTDSAVGGDTHAPQPLLGDSLVLFGAVLYAVCNVAQERLLGDVSNTEMLALLGAFGSLWGAALAALTEGHKLVSTAWTFKVVLPLIGFNVALFAFSSLVPRLLRSGGAATLNLSLLSSDIWAALARLLFFGGFTPASALSFFLAFVLVATGISVFTASSDVKRWADIKFCNTDREGLDRQHDLKPREAEAEAQVLLSSGRPSTGIENTATQNSEKERAHQVYEPRWKQEEIGIELRTSASSSSGSLQQESL